MSRYVVDSSSVLAVLLEEDGHERAAELNQGAWICAVNVTEIVAKCIDFGYPDEAALQYIEDSNISITGLDAETAILAGRLRQRSRTLSLGDRACLALAIRENATAVTADRIWANLDVGCPVELIR